MNFVCFDRDCLRRFGCDRIITFFSITERNCENRLMIIDCHFEVYKASCENLICGFSYYWTNGSSYSDSILKQSCWGILACDELIYQLTFSFFFYHVSPISKLLWVGWGGEHGRTAIYVPTPTPPTVTFHFQNYQI